MLTSFNGATLLMVIGIVGCLVWLRNTTRR